VKSKILSLVLILSLVVIAAVMAGCVPATETPAGGEEGTTTGGITSYLPIIVILVLLFGMFYFLMIRPARQREKKHDEMVEQLAVGDRVITASGIFGVIESIGQDSIVLKVESGATIRVTKGSILGLHSAETMGR